MPLPTTSPSHVGVDARGVLDLLDALAHLDVHSLAIARDGQALARGWWAPYGPDRPHLLYSCSKSITASTVAALAGDGLIDLDAPVLDLLPDVGPVDDRWRSVTVRHCLTMTVGHTEDAWPGRGSDLLPTVLANPPSAAPGSVFAYNQVATYLLSRAVEHVTGTPLDQVALERVLGPLGVTRLDWDRDPQGHPLGFSGARVRTDDLLSLAQLWLDRGVHDGRAVIPSSWFEEATVPNLSPEGGDSDWAHGYGHSFWVARHGYRGDGAYGQYAVVLPEQRVVVAITSEVVDMQEPLDLLWRHLLPAIDRPGDEAADVELAERLRTLTIPALGSDGAAGAQRTWPVDPTSDLPPRYTSVSLADDGGSLTLVRDGEDVVVLVGDGTWTPGELAAAGRTLPVVSSGGWSQGRYRAQIRMIETPHTLMVETGPMESGTAGARLSWRHQPLNGIDPLDLAVR